MLALKDLSDAGNAWGPPLKGRCELARAQPLGQQRVVDEPRQTGPESGSTIEDGSRRARYRDPEMPSPVGARERSSMGPDPSRAAVSKDGDLWALRPLIDEPPESRGREVAQHGLRSARKYRGHREINRRRPPMANGVDAGIDAVEATDAKAVDDRLCADAQRQELRPRDVTALPRR